MIRCRHWPTSLRAHAEKQVNVQGHLRTVSTGGADAETAVKLKTLSPNRAELNKNKYDKLTLFKARTASEIWNSPMMPKGAAEQLQKLALANNDGQIATTDGADCTSNSGKGKATDDKFTATNAVEPAESHMYFCIMRNAAVRISEGGNTCSY